MLKKVYSILLLLVISTTVTPAWSSFFSSCESSAEPKPAWVGNSNYVMDEQYFAIGEAVREGRSKEEQIKASEDDAKSHLVQQIQVTIKAENEQTTSVANQKVQRDITSKIKVTAEEVLRGLTVKGRWTDRGTCTLYTLVAVSKDAIAQARQEKLMKSRLNEFKTQLAEGVDRDKNPAVSVRRKYLEEAQALISDTNFKYLSDELNKDVYLKKLKDALDDLGKESSRAQGRMALFAINDAGATLSNDLIGAMLDQLRTGDNKTDRLMADCNSEKSCISRAKERGFTLLTLLVTDSMVTTSQMGALKGTLYVSRTVYDIESGKVLKGPDKVSAHVIGWNSTELDWSVAADKAMQLLLPKEPDQNSVSVPVAASSVPVAASSVPVAASSVPVAASSVPVAASSVPVAASSVPVAKQSNTLISKESSK